MFVSDGPSNPAAVALFDLDRTLHSGSSLAAIAKYAVQNRLVGKDVAAKAAAQELWYRSGRSSDDRVTNVVNWALELVEGLDISTMDEAEEAVAQRIAESIRPAMRQLFTNHRLAGHRCIVLSASPQRLVHRIASKIDAHDAVGTVLKIEDNVLTGKIEEPFCYGEAKLTRLYSEIGSLPDSADIYAYADSYSDLPVLELADYPIAVTPDRKLKTLAEERSWPIITF